MATGGCAGKRQKPWRKWAGGRAKMRVALPIGLTNEDGIGASKLARSPSCRSLVRSGTANGRCVRPLLIRLSSYTHQIFWTRLTSSSYWFSGAEYLQATTIKPRSIALDKIAIALLPADTQTAAPVLYFRSDVTFTANSECGMGHRVRTTQ